MPLRRLPIVLLSLTCLFASSPHAEGKSKKPDQVIVQFRREALQIGRTAQLTVRTAGTVLSGEMRGLATKVTKGTIEPEPAFGQMFEGCGDYDAKCREAVDLALNSFEARYADLIAAAPQDAALAREIQPFPGSAADAISKTVDFILDESRNVVNRAVAPLAAAFDCAGFPITFTAFAPSRRDTPLLVHLRKLGEVPADFAIDPEVLFAGANCRRTARFKVSKRSLPFFNMVLHLPGGEDRKITEQDDDGHVVVADVPPGNFTYDVFILNQYVKSGVVTVPRWEDEPAGPACGGPATAEIDLAHFQFPPVEQAHATVDAQGNLTDLYAMFRNANDASAGSLQLGVSPGTGVVINVNGAGGDSVTIPEGSFFVTMKLPGAVPMTVPVTTGTLTATGLKHLKDGGDPEGCVGLSLLSTVQADADPAPDQAQVIVFLFAKTFKF